MKNLVYNTTTKTFSDKSIPVLIIDWSKGVNYRREYFESREKAIESLKRRDQNSSKGLGCYFIGDNAAYDKYINRARKGYTNEKQFLNLIKAEYIRS